MENFGREEFSDFSGGGGGGNLRCHYENPEEILGTKLYFSKCHLVLEEFCNGYQICRYRVIRVTVNEIVVDIPP